jgi:hypothetical protein
MAKIECCHNCSYSYWDREVAVRCMGAGIMDWPGCANQPGAYGRMQRVPGRGMCLNYRGRPPEPVGDIRQIPLDNGFYAYVDAADYEWLNRWIWSTRGGYAIRLEKRKVVYMHREIMKTPKGKVVDHKNRNKLDNTRGNLRNCTCGENARNRNKPRGASSRFIGVGYDKRSHKYYARLCHEGVALVIGRYKDEIEAARARDQKAVELIGESARVNFPEEWPAQRRAQVYAQAQVGEGGKEVRRKARKMRIRTKGRSC